MRTDEEIAAWAAAQGFGIEKTQSIREDDPRTIIFRNYVPAMPINVIAFIERAGGAPEYVFLEGTLNLVVETPQIDVIVRNVDNDVAREKIESIYLLAGKIFNSPIIAGGVRWQNMLPMLSPFIDGIDPQHGWFSYRFTIQARKQPSG